MSSSGRWSSARWGSPPPGLDSNDPQQVIPYKKILWYSVVITTGSTAGSTAGIILRYFGTYRRKVPQKSTAGWLPQEYHRITTGQYRRLSLPQKYHRITTGQYNMNTTGILQVSTTGLPQEYHRPVPHEYHRNTTGQYHMNTTGTSQLVIITSYYN